tara:strand:- start:291309 stop:292289 length:981 start_codon:yes stop_codon:yes gene_type:complete
MYTFLKLAPSFASIPLFYILTKNPYNQYAIAGVMAMVSFYAAIGEYFSPLYLYAFIMGMLGFSILLRAKTKTLLPFVAFGGIPTLYMQYLKEVGEITHARQAITFDYVFMALEYMVIIMVIFEGFSKRRRKEMEFRERFSVIGQDLNTFAHNIKSMLSSQFLINQILLNNVSNPQKLEKYLIKNKKTLENIHSYLNKFNVLEKTDSDLVNIKESIANTIELLRVSKASMEVDLSEETHVHAIKQDFETILLNIFSNAMKAITDSDQKIKVFLEENTLTIQYPFSKSYTSSSGIGEQICYRLAQRNNLSLNIGKAGSTQQYEAKIRF